LVHAAWKKRGKLAIFSRYPILRSEARDFGVTNGTVGMQIFARSVTALSGIPTCRLRSRTQYTNLTDKVVETGDLREKETWSSVWSILGKFKRAAQDRASQVERANGACVQ